MALNLDDLVVDSFATSTTSTRIGVTTPGGYCCTGCDSGCGINPTAGSCESGSDDVFCKSVVIAEPVQVYKVDGKLAQ